MRSRRLDAKERQRWRFWCLPKVADVTRLDRAGDTPTFGWALDYEKSRVFYSATQVEAALPGGTVKARGIIRASPRASPNELRPVGTFDAKALRVTK